MVRMEPLIIDTSTADLGPGGIIGGRGLGGMGSSDEGGGSTRSSLDYKGDPKLSDTIIPQQTTETTDEAAVDYEKHNHNQARSSQSPLMESAAAQNPFIGMNNEEIVRYLQENPEVAKKLGIDAAPLPGTNSHSSSNSNDKKRGSSKVYRTELLEKQGFPFIQWTVVLVIVSFVLLRVYKSFSKPPPSSSVKSKSKRKGNYSSKSKAYVQKAAATSAPVNDDSVLNKVVAEIERATTLTSGVSNGLPNASALSKKNKKKSQATNNKKSKNVPLAANNNSQSKTQDVFDNDSGSEAEMPLPQPVKSPSKKHVTIVDSPTIVSTHDNSEDAQGWLTVGNVKASSASSNIEISNNDDNNIISNDHNDSNSINNGSNSINNGSNSINNDSNKNIRNEEVSIISSLISSPIEKNHPATNGYSSANSASIPIQCDTMEKKPNEGKSKKRNKKKGNSTIGATLSSSNSNAHASEAPFPTDAIYPSFTDELNAEVVDDEVLAHRLQEEENKLAGQPFEDDEWAEVSTKRKKKST